MFFVASKIFAALFLPLPLFFLVIFFFFRKISDKRIRFVSYGIWFAGWFFSSTLGSSLIMRQLEKKFPAMTVQQAPKSDAVVVLGGFIDPLIFQGNRPEFYGSVDRLIAGAELLTKNKAQTLLISGGSGLMLQGGMKEGNIIEKWFNELGIFKNRIMSEAISRNTRENAIESAKIIRNKKFKSVLLVTSAFHMVRSQGCFEKTGLNVIAYPVDFKSEDKPVFPESYFPSARGVDIFTMAIREVIGIVAYKAVGYI